MIIDLQYISIGPGFRELVDNKRGTVEVPSTRTPRWRVQAIHMCCYCWVWVIRYEGMGIVDHGLSDVWVK